MDLVMVIGKRRYVLDDGKRSDFSEVLAGVGIPGRENGMAHPAAETLRYALYSEGIKDGGDQNMRCPS